MRTKLRCAILFALFLSTYSFAQFSKVTVTVKWGSNSYENKVELYNTANDLLMTLCDDNQCYTSSQEGVVDSYGAKYDLGCVANGNNYYIKVYDIANDGWQSGAVYVNVAGIEVINYDGSGANSTGEIRYFNVSGGDAACSTELDTDSDGLADYLDYDDDGDGITDGAENLGEDRFECTLPELKFENVQYDASASSSAAGTVGAVYRFSNAIQGYDVLMEITELTNATIANIDNDTVDNPTYLQTELNLIGAGLPGATFQFTIVNAGTVVPSAEIFRINGITWDCDGSGSLKESVIYYDAAAYGTENPTSLEITDLGAGDIQISASGLQEGPGFSTLKVLRAYYQFIGNSFSMRMQGIKTSTGTTKRQFGMSFTQCEFLDFNANSLIIITGEDADGDGKYNHLDLDSDNDGIPDNIEAQPTLGYIAPSLVVDVNTGIDLVYGSGIQVIDTDSDNTPDVLDLDTDNDGLLDIQENGMADSIVVFSDSDNDGLDLSFEGSNINDPLDVNDDIDSPEASILPDTDGDLYTGGDLDYRDLFNTNPPSSAQLDFDGVDDYLTTPSFIEGQTDVTIMAWVRIDNSASGNMTIAGEDVGCKLWINSGIKPRFSLTTAGNSTRTVWGGNINKNEWHHITGVYSSTSGVVKIYVDGVQSNHTGTTSGAIENSANATGTFEIGRASSKVTNKEYFKGAIDEVRVFDQALTEDQIRRMVYQEIEQNSGNVRGSVISKDVIDMATDTKVSWNNLVAYYPMTDIVSSRTYDYSNNNRDLSLFNITTIQEQTAPMPYESSSDGDWSETNTWLHGDVWDIEDEANNKDWSIVKFNSDVVSTSNSHTQLGMIIENDGRLNVNNDQEIKNTWYLELNGTLNLEGDSQLVQTTISDLVTEATGKLIRSQRGNSSLYRYTYMSSPVGLTGATTLSDNNASTNNTNNSVFRLNLLKEGNGNSVEFTSAYDQVGKLSTRWTYTFVNGITYYDWGSLSPTTSIAPGVGYIHKGLGNGGSTQEYSFEGKPNNGTILIVADDVNGDSGNESQPDVTQTTTLIGNPYPSALDAHQFIDDNAGIIDGTLYLWQQWAGDNHILREYEGGYATLNKMAKIRAYQFEGLSGGTNGSQDGTLTPRQYIPVGQSFMTEVIADGNIEFNNAQRAFKKEDAGESEFFRASEKSHQDEKAQSKTTVEVIKMAFTTSSNLTREFVLGFSGFTTLEYDYGYDAKLFDLKSDDMYTVLGDQKLIAHAYPMYTADTEIPLHFVASAAGKYNLRAVDFTDFDPSTGVYLKDNDTNTYFDLKAKSEGYAFSTDGAGEFTDRFVIVFKTNKKEVSETEAMAEATTMYFNRSSKQLVVEDLNAETADVIVYNTIGQQIATFTAISNDRLKQGLQLYGLSSGVYVITLQTDTNKTLHKNIAIN